MDKYITLEDYQELIRTRTSKDASGVTFCEYDGVTLDSDVVQMVKDLKTFEVRSDDVWIITYPKTGTTWAQEIASCVMHDGDLEAVNKRHTFVRVPVIEMAMQESVRRLKNLPEPHKIVAEMASPRVIKSHLPGHLLPPQIWEKKAKIVYVIRNPKDMIVSYFHFAKMYYSNREEQPFGEFLDAIIAGKVEYGRWWEHYLCFWKKRHDPNILLVRFEDMKKDLRANVEKISQFLGKNLPAEKLDAITEHCTFANMKNNPMANMDTMYTTCENQAGSFMRKGEVGDWKSHFTVAQNETMDALIRDKLDGTGLTFDFN